MNPLRSSSIIDQLPDGSLKQYCSLKRSSHEIYEQQREQQKKHCNPIRALEKIEDNLYLNLCIERVFRKNLSSAYECLNHIVFRNNQHIAFALIQAADGDFPLAARVIKYISNCQKQACAQELCGRYYIQNLQFFKLAQFFECFHKTQEDAINFALYCYPILRKSFIQSKLHNPTLRNAIAQSRRKGDFENCLIFINQLDVTTEEKDRLRAYIAFDLSLIGQDPSIAYKEILDPGKKEKCGFLADKLKEAVNNHLKQSLGVLFLQIERAKLYDHCLHILYLRDGIAYNKAHCML